MTFKSRSLSKNKCQNSDILYRDYWVLGENYWVLREEILVSEGRTIGFWGKSYWYMREGLLGFEGKKQAETRLNTEVRQSVTIITKIITKYITHIKGLNFVC